MRVKLIETKFIKCTWVGNLRMDGPSSEIASNLFVNGHNDQILTETTRVIQ